MDESGGGAGSAQNIQEPASSEPKNALVWPIHPIETRAVPMMDTRCRSMRGPPDGQKERKPQAIQVSPILNPTGLNPHFAVDLDGN
jgi:hypothetical protein